MKPSKPHDLSKFDPKKFLATIGEGRSQLSFSKSETVFCQDDACDAVFYIQEGKIKLTVVSHAGKEATIGILNPGEFFGGQPRGPAPAHGISHGPHRLRNHAGGEGGYAKGD